MSNRTHFNTNRNVLERCAVFFWKHLADRYMRQACQCKIAIDRLNAWILAEIGIHFVETSWIFSDTPRLQPIDSSKRLIRDFAVSVHRSPFICMSERREDKNGNQNEFHKYIVHTCLKVSND